MKRTIILLMTTLLMLGSIYCENFISDDTFNNFYEYTYKEDNYCEDGDINFRHLSWEDTYRLEVEATINKSFKKDEIFIFTNETTSMRFAFELLETMNNNKSVLDAINDMITPFYCADIEHIDGLDDEGMVIHTRIYFIIK